MFATVSINWFPQSDKGMYCIAGLKIAVMQDTVYDITGGIS